MTKELQALETLKDMLIGNGINDSINDYVDNLILPIKQALQRLDKYEQILSSGRLTDRNYKNTTLPLDSCKPYLRLGELEDIYEEGK